MLPYSLGVLPWHKSKVIASLAPNVPYQKLNILIYIVQLQIYLSYPI